MELLSLNTISITDEVKFTKENIKDLQEYFAINRSTSFIQKVIDDEVKFDTDALMYMMKESTKARDNKSILFINEDEKEHIIVGDIHADALSLNKILTKTFFYDNYEDKRIVFLGDYVDRGQNKLFTINLIIALEFLLPQNIVVLKGNHELFVRDENNKIQSPMQGRESLSYFFTFLNMLSSNEKYKEMFPNEFIESYASYFQNLPLLGMLEFENIKIMLVHGGIARANLQSKNYYEEFNSLDDFFVEGKKDSVGMSLQNNFLWSDPYDANEKGFRNNSKTRFQFSKNQFTAFCKKFDIDMILRAHEAQDDGYKTYYESRLISVFSTGGKDINGNSNKNSYYTAVTPNILKIDTQEKSIQSYEIFFDDTEMLCEEKFYFRDILEQKKSDEKEFIDYIPHEKEDMLNTTKILHEYKILKITDKYNKYVSKTIKIKAGENIQIGYKLLEDFYGVHHELKIIIDQKNNSITNNSTIPIKVDRFTLNKNQSLPYSDGEYLLQSGGCLYFELLR